MPDRTKISPGVQDYEAGAGLTGQVVSACLPACLRVLVRTQDKSEYKCAQK